jgi:hypothetical protein
MPPEGGARPGRDEYSPPGVVVHFAGQDMEINGVKRQRCLWCGSLLIEWDLARVMVRVPEDGSPPVGPGVFEVGANIGQADGMSWIVPKEEHPEHPGSYVIPDASCALLDPSVTGSTPHPLGKLPNCAECHESLYDDHGRMQAETGPKGWQHANPTTCLINLGLVEYVEGEDGEGPDGDE